ncbi:MAG: class I SAM-dependent methyltransferase [Cytophagales bacterium]|nr:class I SAM-dependent methyltransferase [Cytophagales bacterium]
MQERTFDNFDEFSDNYRYIHTQNIGFSGADSDYFSRYRIEEIERMERKRYHTEEANVHILDIGSGDGNAARFFEQYFPKGQVIGIDITEKVVQKAIGRNLSRSIFQVYDGKNIPFADNTFDIVFMVGTLHHVDRKYHVPLLKETHRVLNTSGRFYNFEHNPWNPVTQKVVKDCVFDKDAVLLSSIYLNNIEKQAGFKNLDTRFTIFFPRHKIFNSFIKLEKYLHKIPLGGQYYIVGTK